MEKLHIRKIASLGLMLYFFTGGGAQTPVKVEYCNTCCQGKCDRYLVTCII